MCVKITALFAWRQSLLYWKHYHKQEEWQSLMFSAWAMNKFFICLCSSKRMKTQKENWRSKNLCLLSGNRELVHLRIESLQIFFAFGDISSYFLHRGLCPPAAGPEVLVFCTPWAVSLGCEGISDMPKHLKYRCLRWSQINFFRHLKSWTVDSVDGELYMFLPCNGLAFFTSLSCFKPRKWLFLFVSFLHSTRKEWMRWTVWVIVSERVNYSLGETF